MAAAGDRINDARRHIRSARTIVEDDRTLAFAACHDAIRKAITAHMTALGYRPRAGEGAHRIVLDYARQQLHTVITKDQLDDADAIRGGCTCTPDTDATAHNEVEHTATSRQL